MRNINNIFYWLSKTDVSIIEHMPQSVKLTQLSLGMTVMFTAILAFFSGSYAIYTSFESILLAVIVGSIYAAVIMNIDREIISITSKNAAFLRIPLALVIGLIISVPLELKILEQRIDQELVRQNEIENTEVINRITNVNDNFMNRRAKLQEEIQTLRGRIDEYNRNLEAEAVGRVKIGRTGVAGRGPAYNELLIAKNDALVLMKNAQNDLNNLEVEFAMDNKNAKEIFSNQHIEQSYDLLSRIEALEIIKGNSVAAFWMAWGIRILFILIEIMPALLRVFSKYSEYDALCDARSRVNIQRIHGYANANLDALENDSSIVPKPTLIQYLVQDPLTS